MDFRTAEWLVEMATTQHDSYRWKNPKNGVSAMVRKYNPICQRILENGKQCTHPSTIVHHLIDWRKKPEQFYDWTVLVACCADCHPASQPGDLDTNTWTHTCGPCDSVYEHNGGWPCWHPNYIPPAAPVEGGLPPGCTSSALGDALLDAALAQP